MSLKTKFERVIRPVTSTKVFIHYDADKGRLSITGKGRHGVGQVYEYLVTDTPAPGFTKLDCCILKIAWERWHLNDMRAGTPRQEEAVRNWRRDNPNKGYNEACEMLSELGILVDDGYRYGTSWLKEEVPMDVLEWLFSLPGDGDGVDDLYFLPGVNEEAFYTILNIC